ncbi:hypothetical protein QZH41_018183 [Actinostola sp. cb2023]|nr:hypothetical protein QZH41_018183 [Actinostola sp. cb2023]
MGKFIGRSYLFFFSCCFDVSAFLKCRHTWIFALINLVHLILFLCESWYHFLPGIWLVVLLCSTVGLTSGLIVLHSPHAVNAVLMPDERVTTWTCVSPRTAILITAPWSILYLIFYAILDKEPVLEGPRSAQETALNYEKIEDSDPDDIDEEEIQHFSREELMPKKKPKGLGCNEKMNVSWKLVPFIVPLLLSFFAEYMINSSIVTTISFPKSGLLPRDHYQYYSLSYRMGKFIGRSYLFFFSCCFDVSAFLKCRHTWIFALINLVHLILFLCESWYHFLPGIWLVVLLCSTVGLTSGLIVLHSPHAVNAVLMPDEREFGFGLLTVGNAVGAFIAGIVGLAVEPYLKNECHLHFTTQKEFCITRQRNSTGWSTNVHC